MRSGDFGELLMAGTIFGRGSLSGQLAAAPYSEFMSLEWEQVVVDTARPAELGRWWANALGWVVTIESDDEYEIRPAPDRMPGILFAPVPDSKNAKNRLHLDFRPDDQGAEVERMLALGASKVDIGQGEQPWVVLADPEGNEFCILGARKASPEG